MSEVPVIERGIEKSADSVRDYVRAAWSHQAKREFAQAKEIFQKALELDAGSVDAQYGLAMTLKMLDQQGPAVTAFEKVISLLKESEPEDKVRADMLVRLAKAQIEYLKPSASPS